MLKRKSSVIMVFLIIISSIFNGPAVVYAEDYQFTSVVTSPAILTEDNLKWAEITMTIANDVFKNPLNPSDVHIHNQPAGVTVESVTRINDTTVLMKLDYNFDDFDTNDTDFHVDTGAAATVGGKTYGNWYLPITAIVEPVQSLKALTGSSLSETNLDGATIELVLGSNDFNSSLLTNQFTLNNAPAGLSITSVIRGSQRQHATMTLAFDGTDFDTDISNFNITALDAAHNGSYNTTSNNLSISAVVEPFASIIATTIPNELNENTLAGSIVNLTLNSDGFKATLGTGDIQLKNGPMGLSVANVVRKSTTQAQVILGFDGTDFDADFDDFSIAVLSSGLETAPVAYSSQMTINPICELEGLPYVETKEAYPSDIEMTGYNAKTKEFFMNTSLRTPLDTTGKTATFKYFVKIYNGNGTEIGSYGNIAAPHSVTAPAEYQNVNINNLVVTLTQDLPVAYKVTVVVESVVIT